MCRVNMLLSHISCLRRKQCRQVIFRMVQLAVPDSAIRVPTSVLPHGEMLPLVSNRRRLRTVRIGRHVWTGTRLDILHEAPNT